MRGARVVGIAGSDDKCRWLEKDLGFDVALNYKAAGFKDKFLEVTKVRAVCGIHDKLPAV
jgi:NADPH-dependent curcumin reductase CurA